MLPHKTTIKTVSPHLIIVKVDSFEASKALLEVVKDRKRPVGLIQFKSPEKSNPFGFIHKIRSLIF